MITQNPSSLPLNLLTAANQFFFTSTPKLATRSSPATRPSHYSCDNTRIQSQFTPDTYHFLPPQALEPKPSHAFNAPTATMSNPAGEAPTAPAAPVAAAPTPQQLQSDAATVPPSAPAQASVAPQQQSVSGGSGNVAQAGPSHTIPTTPTGGAPAAGRGPPVPRQAAAPTRDTFAMRSLGPAVNSQVKKVRLQGDKQARGAGAGSLSTSLSPVLFPLLQYS